MAALCGRVSYWPGGIEMKRPTDRQCDYAESLAATLADAHNIKADFYSRRVLECNDRADMSRLIGEMKKLANELEGDPFDPAPTPWD